MPMLLKRVFLNDNVILFLILLNALIIFVSGFDLGEKYNFLLHLFDNFVTFLFIIELVVKISIYGRSYFDTNWNRFDFILIILSIPALIIFILKLDAYNYSFLMVFRVMRVFKSFRFLKFIPGIDHLIRGINRSIKASVIVILGFVIYLFIIGIFSFYLFKESSPEYFNDPLVSLYSIFKIFTIEGWFEIPDQVTKNMSPIASLFTYIYFIFSVLSGGVLGLSLVNSIFVDAMVSDNNDELEKKIERLESKIDQLLDNQSANKGH